MPHVLPSPQFMEEYVSYANRVLNRSWDDACKRKEKKMQKKLYLTTIIGPKTDGYAQYMEKQKRQEYTANGSTRHGNGTDNYIIQML